MEIRSQNLLRSLEVFGKRKLLKWACLFTFSAKRFYAITGLVT